MKRWILPFLMVLAACSREPEQPLGNAPNEAAPPAPAAPAENRVAVPMPDQRSPEAAVAVLTAYFGAIAEERYADAYRLWSDEVRASGMNAAEFAASFASFADYRGQIGAPGRMEGAAGSSYIDIPVRVTGRLKSGERFKQTGTMTLRRVNDVPGATAEQLQWRIYKADLKPRSIAGDFRFAGRWAASAGNCAGRAWQLTATSITAPGGKACSFSKVTQAPGGYDIAASCTAGGPAKDERIRLRYAESARALLVESRTLGDVGLTRCG
jgi:hypothetical protein